MARKKKLDIAAEDMDVAKNLGVNVEKEKPAKVDRKKFRQLREAINIGAVSRAEGPITKEGKLPAGKKPVISKDVIEKRRYESALAKGAIFNAPERRATDDGVVPPVSGVERPTVNRDNAAPKDIDRARAERNKKRENARARESALTEEYNKTKASPGDKTFTGTSRMVDDDVLKASGKKEIEARISNPNPFGINQDTPKVGRFEKKPAPVKLGTPEVSLTTSAGFTDLDKVRVKARSEQAMSDVVARAAESQKNKEATAKALAEVNKSRREKGLAPVFDPMSASASLHAPDKGEAPSVYDYMGKSSERMQEGLEKARPIIAEKTGKAPEQISYSGDEPYDVKDKNGNVVATRTVNSHALKLAQRAHREAKHTGKEVEGFKPTDPRPTKTEDILGTPHQAMAYQLRHLPGLSENDVRQAPGLSRKSFELKSQALMGAAVNKAESNRMIPVANEVQPHHKGWEDEKGILHPFTFQKDGKVSPLSLPSDFTRTAQPKAMIHIPDDDSTESLMGSHEVNDHPDSVNQGFHTVSSREVNASPVMKKAGITGKIGSYEQDAVVSHEGYTLHDDNVWRKIKHPLAGVPEDQKMHVGDYVAANAAMMVDDKAAAAKKGKGSKSAVKQIAKALKTRQTTLTSAKQPFHWLTNPKPPSAETNKEMLVRNMTDVAGAVERKDITKKQAAIYSPQFRPKKEQKPLIVEPKPGGFPYKSKEEYKDLSRNDKIAYNKSVSEHKAAQKAKSEKRIAKSLSPNKSVYEKKYRDADAIPAGKVESSAYTKAKTDVAAGRQFRTVEIGNTIKTVVNQNHADQKSGYPMSEGNRHAVNELGTAIITEKNTYGLTPEEAKKKDVYGQKSFKVMDDPRGPVRETEVHAKMQGLPERTDVKAAVKAGKIHPEEAKDLRQLDQFSPYRKQTEAKITAPTLAPNASQEDKQRAKKDAKAARIARGKEGLEQAKYSIVHDITIPRKPAPDRPGTPIEELNKRTEQGRKPRTAESMVQGGPVKDIVKPKNNKKVVPDNLKRVYGETVDVPKEKPKNRGQAGSVREGRGKQFSNWSGPVSVTEGTTMVHPKLGRGLVLQRHEAGDTVPGTGKVVSAGNATRQTKLKGAKKFDVPHVSFAPESSPQSAVHVPVSDFQ